MGVATIRDHRPRFTLAIDCGQAPVGDDYFSAGSHIANLAGDLDLLALGGFGKPLLQLGKFLAALTSPANFFLAFADAHRGRLGTGG